MTAKPKKSAKKTPSIAEALYPDRVAYENTLGLRMVRRHADGVTLELPIRPDILNGNGVMHGGVLASIADEVAWHAILHGLGTKDRNMTTSELKINYLRPIGGKKVIARGYIVKLGKTLCVTRIDLMDEKRKLGALAIVTYMLLA
ncbi:MAG: PaaI family thioesterase [Bryobacteraceae bacterium]